MSPRLEARARVLAAFGAGGGLADELSAYDRDGFGDAALPAGLRFPLADEPFVEAWRDYAGEASSAGFSTLADRLVQLRFPIRHGISQTEEYRAATRRGEPTAGMSSATGLVLTRPQECSVTIHPTWAGSIPVLTAGCDDDFVSLLRALTARNEPVAVPASQGACIVAGYNNWDRIRRFEDHWNRDHPDTAFSLGLLADHKDQYQDRFILLGSGWYSGVPPETVGVHAAEWRRLSLVIRREHECAHYWTRRVLSTMRNRVLDEIVADYCGIFAACGRLRGDWLLAFLGIRAGHELRDGGRLLNYRGDPPLSDAAFEVLQRLVIAAVENLESFDRRHAEVIEGRRGLLAIPLALSRLSLEDLAGDQARTLLDDALESGLASVEIGVASR